MLSKFASASGMLVANNLQFIDLAKPAGGDSAKAPATLRAFFDKSLSVQEMRAVQTFMEGRMNEIGVDAVDVTHANDTYWTQMLFTFKTNPNLNPSDVLLNMKRFVEMQQQEMLKAERASALARNDAPKLETIL